MRLQNFFGILDSIGCEAIRNISVMTYPRELEDLTFSQISDIIKRNLHPKKKLIIAERTKFFMSKH